MFKLLCSISLITLMSLNIFADEGNRDHREGKIGPWDRRPPVERIIYQRVDGFQVQKFLETTNTLPVNVPNVKTIQLLALNNDVEITEARVLLDDGREVYMDGITGALRRNRNIIYTLNGYMGERVRSITIRALSRNLIGSRASLDVSVGVLR